MGAEEYYRLISRAVAALEINTFEDRRAIYNRARAVQSYQLGKRPFNKAATKQHRPHTDDATPASAILAQKRASPCLARLTLWPQSAAPRA